MSLANFSTKEELIAYLNQLNVAVLSTASAEGKPHAAAVYFIVDHDLHFYFLTLSETKKSINLQENKSAALATLDIDNMITIQTTGTVHMVTDPEQHTLLIKQLSEANAKKNKPQWPPPVSHVKNGGDIIVYKFTPHWLRAANFSKENEVVKEFIPVR